MMQAWADYLDGLRQMSEADNLQANVALKPNLVDRKTA